MSCHFLLQWIFPTQGSKPGLPHCRKMLYSLSHQGSCCPWLSTNPLPRKTCHQSTPDFSRGRPLSAGSRGPCKMRTIPISLPVTSQHSPGRTQPHHPLTHRTYVCVCVCARARASCLVPQPGWMCVCLSVLVPQPGTDPRPSAVKAWNPNLDHQGIPEHMHCNGGGGVVYLHSFTGILLLLRSRKI